MRSLQSFASPTNTYQIFRDASPLPAFFQHNLVDPSRVVKHFTCDPQANIRVFYYQYLKLCFQLENVDFEGYIRRIEELINNEEFKFIFCQEDDPQLFSDLQFKQLIMEFFGVLGQGGASIQQAINYYPIMDTVFIYFFRALLILTGRTDALDSYINREELFQFLCTYFNVEITIHDKCIKFVESDIFVYEEDPKDVYMAYMEEPEEDAEGQQGDEGYIGNEEHYQNEGNGFPQGGHHHYHPQTSQFQHFSRDEQQPHPQMPLQISNNPISKLPPQPTRHQDPTPIHDISYSSSSQRGASDINKSYISSQFVDYTQTASNLTSIVKKDLKESAEIAKQPTFGKILLENQQEPNISSFKINNKSNSEIKQPILDSSAVVYESPLNALSYHPQKDKAAHITNHHYDIEPSSNSYGAIVPTQTNTKKTPYDQSHHHQQTPFSKKTQENSYISKAWQAPPTKDPGFSKLNQVHTSYQYQQLPPVQINKYTQERYDHKKPSSYATHQQKIQQKKPTSAFQSSKQTYSTYNYTNNIATSSNNNKFTSTPITNYKPPQLHPTYPQLNPLTYSKQPYNLNVSLQFTNSFTMKVMAQPYRSNVYTIRNRARDYRNSLKNYIK